MTVLILAPDWEPHYQYIQPILLKRKVDFVRLSGESYPEYCAASFELSDSSSNTYFLQDGKKFYSSDILSVWNPYLTSSKPIDVNDPYHKKSLEKESDYLLDALYRTMDTAVWVNHIEADKRANKLCQLTQAKEVGFIVPDTYIGNDVEQAKNFISKHSDLCIKNLALPHTMRSKNHFEKFVSHYRWVRDSFKKQNKVPLFWSLEEYLNANKIKVPTKRVDQKTLLENIDLLSYSPAIIQAYIPKLYELRVTVVGNKIFPCAIYSQEHASTQEDWRVSQDEISFKHISLPTEIEEKCFHLMKKLNLEFGAIDMIVTPEKEYYFLEVNTTHVGWGYIDHRASLNIGEALVDLLACPDGNKLN
ncbi:MAG: hypothetical protein KTR14_02390 [Vampirovibrio sp.]|nr:hypothetical protein [Vampirovibrio sp.]